LAALRRVSQRKNINVRDLADQIVAKGCVRHLRNGWWARRAAAPASEEVTHARTPVATAGLSSPYSTKVQQS
jgi:hypothetical protein